MTVYLYKCNNGHITEHNFPLGKNEETVICKKDNNCEEVARRYIGAVPPVIYNGTGFVSTEIPRKSGLEDIRM